MSRESSPFLLRLNDDVRDITLRRSTLLNAVVSSSANPSLNGRLLESPPTFVNGRTAIETAAGRSAEIAAPRPAGGPTEWTTKYPARSTATLPAPNSNRFVAGRGGRATARLIRRQRVSKRPTVQLPSVRIRARSRSRSSGFA